MVKHEAHIEKATDLHIIFNDGVLKVFTGRGIYDYNNLEGVSIDIKRGHVLINMLKEV